MTNTPSRLVFRQHELQAMLGLSRNAIERLISDGSLKPPIMLGPRSKGFLVSDVEQWLESRKEQRDSSARPSRPCA